MTSIEAAGRLREALAHEPDASGLVVTYAKMKPPGTAGRIRYNDRVNF